MLEFQAQRIHYGPEQQMPPHADGCRRLSIVVGGELFEAPDGIEDGSERALIGSVALKGPNFFHHNRFGPDGTTIVSAILPDRTVTRLGATAPLVDWGWRHDLDAALVALRLAVALHREDGAEAGRALRLLLRTFVAPKDAAANPELAAPPLRLTRIAEELRCGNARPISEIARSLGCHPVALGRSFGAHFGVSPTQYRQRSRVLAAGRALLSSSRPLVDVALEHEFSDLSHMTRQFRRHLSLPPGAFRLALRDERPAQAQTEAWTVAA